LRAAGKSPSSVLIANLAIGLIGKGVAGLQKAS
jgi:hypothetical protein